MLEGSKFRTPSSVFCHGFLTIDGEKMSKSRGTFFNARTYLKHLDPEYLRYYFASRLNDKIEDIDLNFDDFVARVNSDLVGKIVNIGSRCAKFINGSYDSQLCSESYNKRLITEILENKKIIVENYENRNFSKNIRLISSLADDINKYIDNEKPWKMIKDTENKDKVHKVCSDGINMFRLLIGYLKPVIPNIALKVEKILQCDCMNWSNLDSILTSHQMGEFKSVIGRIEKDSIELMKNEAKGEIND